MRRGMDMDYCPFCSNRRDLPSPPVPLELRGQTKPVHAPTVEPIPVHLVGSERSLSDSAVKIQKAFRGFLVRKCVQKIAAIRKEVDEIEYKIAEKYTFDLILRDSNERLKVTETLMSLLFRLDSVRGVDAGVRNFRKSVIKKAIALQELVDLVVAGNQKPESAISKTVNQNETVKFGENAVNRIRKRGYKFCL